MNLNAIFEKYMRINNNSSPDGSSITLQYVGLWYAVILNRVWFAVTFVRVLVGDGGGV